MAALAAALAVSTAAPPAPTPASVLGWEPCADYKLATYEQIADYFRKLDLASDRLQLVEIGKTAEGRPQLMAIISSEQNLKQLERYKGIARKLALGRDGSRAIGEAEARGLARDGKAVVWIDFGLHSDEVAHAQTAPLLAYKAVTDESDEMKAIRSQVIFLLLPNMNPDGTTLVANWYRQQLGTPYERSSPPELYQKYVGHDNNRDWFMFNQPETRNVGRQLYAEWFPQIVYNQHQTGPFPSRIFVPPFDDPMNPWIPPLVMRGVNLVGDAMTRRLDREGKRGAISRVGFDTWWNGGMRTAPYFHNMIGILTETSHASASPSTYNPRGFPRTFDNGTPTLEPSTFYPSPYLGGEWHLRDSCDYMVTTSMAVLDLGARRREEWLFDIYRMGHDAVRAGAKDTFVVPTAQWDLATAVKMINVLRQGGVEVERATGDFTSGGRRYAAGTFLIRGAQPFRPYIADLLTPQAYPDLRLFPGGPPKRPYDITGWTLSLQMGVAVDRVAEAVTVASERVDRAQLPTVTIPPSAGAAYALDPRINDSALAVNRLLAAGETVYRAPGALDVGGERWPAGTFLIPPRPETGQHLAASAGRLGLRIGRIDQWPAGGLLQLRAARTGLYHGWGGNTDEGWTRGLLEQFEFPFTVVHDAEIREGGLRARFDIILLPDDTYGGMVNGLEPGSMPPEYVGGMTDRGVANLRQFVNDGGTLVAMDRAAQLPLSAFDLPVRDVTRNQRASDLFIPGSLLKLQVDPDEPVGFGMPADATAFFIHSPAFAVDARATGADLGQAAETERPHIVARYPDRDLLRSGWILGDRILAGRAAVIEAPVGRGRVVLLGFRTQHRGQPHGTFKLLFNSIYLGGSTRADTAAAIGAAGTVGRDNR